MVICYVLIFYQAKKNKKMNVKQLSKTKDDLLIIESTTFKTNGDLFLEKFLNGSHLQLRTSRLSMEEWGVVAFHMKKREQNFTRTLFAIFTRSAAPQYSL